MNKIYIKTIGTGKPLILVHGWAMHSGIWGNFARELAKQYRIVMVDLPGHGRSAPIVPFILPAICALLAEEIADEPCCWLGWSLGTQVVLHMAAAYPERINKLILLAGSPHFVKTDGWPGMAAHILDNFAKLLLIDGEENLTRFLSLQVKDSDNPKSTLSALRSALASAKFPDQQTLQDGLQILKTADLRPEMAHLQQPVCAILGTHDTLVSAKTGAAMQQLLPSLQLHLIDRAGHTPFLSHIQQVVGVIRQFMDDKYAY